MFQVAMLQLQRTYYLYRNGDQSNMPYDFLYDNNKIKSFDVLLAVLTEMFGRHLKGGRVLKLYKIEKSPIPTRICTLVELERLADSQCVFAGNEPYVKIPGGYGEHMKDNVSVVPLWQPSDTRKRATTAIAAHIGYVPPTGHSSDSGIGTDSLTVGGYSVGGTSTGNARSVSAVMQTRNSSSAAYNGHHSGGGRNSGTGQPSNHRGTYERSRNGAIVVAGSYDRANAKTTSSSNTYRRPSSRAGDVRRTHSFDSPHNYSQHRPASAAHSDAAVARRSIKYSQRSPRQPYDSDEETSYGRRTPRRRRSLYDRQQTQYGKGSRSSAGHDRVVSRRSYSPSRVPLHSSDSLAYTGRPHVDRARMDTAYSGRSSVDRARMDTAYSGKYHAGRDRMESPATPRKYKGRARSKSPVGRQRLRDSDLLVRVWKNGEPDCKGRFALENNDLDRLLEQISEKFGLLGRLAELDSGRLATTAQELRHNHAYVYVPLTQKFKNIEYIA